MFPSPYGDYGSYLGAVETYLITWDEFPSPYGDYGSYLNVWVKAAMAADDAFPSPYGDYGSYQYQLIRLLRLLKRFRPLTGIMVLIASR